MKKLSQITISVFLSFLCLIPLLLPFQSPIFSGEIDDLEDEIEEKQDEIEENESLLEEIEARISEISNSKYSLSEKISLLGEEVSEMGDMIDAKEIEIDTKLEEIDAKEKLLAEKQALLGVVSGELYVESRFGFYNFLFSGKGLDDFFESLYIRKSTISMLADEIEEISGEFSNLAEARTNLENEKEELDEEKEILDESYALLDAERSKLQAELNTQYVQKSGVSADIEDLTKKVSQLQEALIAARSAGFISTGGTTGSEEGTAISQAPSGYWGVFSIGAYTHRNGMSQWGARARADAGQTYTQILNAYYPGKIFRTGDVVISGTTEEIMTNITTTTYGPLNFEDDYLLRLQEVPESWPMEVLKAQAIAARTFAINYTNNGRGTICTDQNCQVVGSSKKTGAWKTAVETTRGMVLTISSGAPFSTQYAAVHGGWINSVGWDTQSGGGSDWFNDAWEKISGVTWFYKSWYREGYTTSGTNCGHTPWLSSGEMVNMINSYLIKNGIGLKKTPDLSRLLPSDYGLCPGRLDYGRTDKDPYTSSELKSLLISPVNTVYSVSMSLSNGNTTDATFHTDVGAKSITGMGFKNIYNQTAPGHMRIQQQPDYSYFNIEKK